MLPMLLPLLLLSAVLAGGGEDPIDTLVAAAEAQRAHPLSEARFLAGDPADAAAPGFDDHAWRPVALPHCWSGDAVGWYRIALPATAMPEGKRLFLRVGAAASVCQAWLDGRPVGEHLGGYSAFTLPLGPGDGAPHLLALRVQREAAGAPPAGTDWRVYGGLYRPMALLALDDVAIDPVHLGAGGLTVVTDRCDAAMAALHATVRVRNDGDVPVQAAVRVRVLDTDGAACAETPGALLVGAGATAELSLPLVLAAPRLWRGIADPYRYLAEAEITVDGTVRDRVRVACGVRGVAIDAERGLLLDGEPYPLRGVCYHQEVAERGWEAGPADIAADLDTLQALGSTGVRLVHYPHGQATLDACDRRGLVAWVEIPVYNHVGSDPGFTEQAERQLRELVAQTANHPCAAIVAVGNEVRLGKGPDPSPLLARLVATARVIAPERIVTIAAKSADALEDGLQAVGYNVYKGWYGGTLAEVPATLDALRRERCPVGLSEFGAGSNIERHSAMPERMDYTEEYQCRFHEAWWRAARARPWLWCDFVWLGFDVASDRRNDGGMPGINNKGLVTRDRAVRKDAFFWYQAQWSSTPMVHILGRRAPAAAVQEVLAYSNQPRVELRLDGVGQGIATVEDGIARWPAVALHPGDNAVEVVAVDDPTVRDACTWAVR